jgi:hypothetical protein
LILFLYLYLPFIVTSYNPARLRRGSCFGRAATRNHFNQTDPIILTTCGKITILIVSLAFHSLLKPRPSPHSGIFEGWGYVYWLCLTKRFGMDRLSPPEARRDLRQSGSTPDVEAILPTDCCVKEASRPIDGCNAARDSDCSDGLW